MMINTPPSTSSNFLGFNFEPMYEEEYGPDNWLKAVNSENFRKSIYYALDRGGRCHDQLSLTIMRDRC